jgi:hypothetical protein
MYNIVETILNMSYIRHIEVSFKQGKRDEGQRQWNSRKSKGIKRGFMKTGSLDDPQKAVNISLWETREDMDNYHANDKDYSAFLDSLKPSLLEKSDYTVFKLDLDDRLSSK